MPSSPPLLQDHAHNEPLKKVCIYADGSCLSNPGPGGWAALLIFEGHQKEIIGSNPHTTNNIMELTAALEALKILRQAVEVDLFTDSRYVVDGMSQWVDTWQRNQWRTVSRQPVKNKDLWESLLKESCRHKVHWHWVKGHGEDQQNAHVDFLARNAARKVASLQRDKNSLG